MSESDNSPKQKNDKGNGLPIRPTVTKVYKIPPKPKPSPLYSSDSDNRERKNAQAIKFGIQFSASEDSLDDEIEQDQGDGQMQIKHAVKKRPRWYQKPYREFKVIRAKKEAQSADQFLVKSDDEDDDDFIVHKADEKLFYYDETEPHHDSSFAKHWEAFKQQHFKIQRQMQNLKQAENDKQKSHFENAKGLVSYVNVLLTREYSPHKTPFHDKMLKEMQKFYNQKMYLKSNDGAISLMHMNLLENKLQMGSDKLQIIGNDQSKKNKEFKVGLQSKTQSSLEQPVQITDQIITKYIVKGSLQSNQIPDTALKMIKYQGFGKPEIEQEVPCNPKLQLLIDRMNQHADQQEVRRHKYPLTIANKYGELLVPKYFKNTFGEVKYTRMTNMNDGILSLPRSFYNISSMPERAYILSKRLKATMIGKEIDERIPNLLQASRFNPLFKKMLATLHYAYKTKFTCSHFQPHQKLYYSTDFARYKSYMSLMQNSYAQRYLCTVEEVNDLLNDNDQALKKRINQFTKPGLGFVQHLASNHQLKQHCHDISQKTLDIPGRVPPLIISYIVQSHSQNLCLAQDSLPPTSNSLAYRLMAYSKIMLDVENIPQILASLNGVDSIEARLFEGIPMFTYGEYNGFRTFRNKKILRYKGDGTQLKYNNLMKHEHISEFNKKKIKSVDGVVTIRQVYAFDIEAQLGQDGDEEALFLEFKQELAVIILQLASEHYRIDTLIFEVCFVRDDDYVDVPYFEAVEADAKQNRQPRKDTRLNISGNCKLYKLKNDQYDIKFRFRPTFTQTELQSHPLIYENPDDLIHAAANGTTGLDQEFAYESFASFDDFRKLNCKPKAEPNEGSNAQSQKKSQQHEAYRRMCKLKGFQGYVLAREFQDEMKAATAQVLGCLFNNDDTRHTSHQQVNHSAIVELSGILQTPDDHVCEYFDNQQKIQTYPPSKMTMNTFKALVNEAGVAFSKELTNDDINLYKSKEKMLEIYKYNQPQRKRTFLQKFSDELKQVLSGPDNVPQLPGEIKDYQGSTMPLNVLGHILDLYYLPTLGPNRDSNMVITGVIASVMKRYLKTDKLQRHSAIFLCEQEIIRASQTNTLAYNIVWGQWPLIFDQQTILQYLQTPIRLSLQDPLYLLEYFEIFNKSQLIRNTTIIFTDVPDAHKFISRAAFTLFMHTRYSGMAVNEIRDFYINTISVYNWFQYLGFLIVVIPAHVKNHKQIAKFIDSPIDVLKSWAFYQIFTVVVVMRPDFLKELDALLQLRQTISSTLGSTEGPEFYKNFILDPMINQDFSSYDEQQPFRNLASVNLQSLGIWSIQQVQVSQLVQLKNQTENYCMTEEDDDENHEEMEVMANVYPILYPNAPQSKQMKGGVRSVKYTKDPGQYPFIIHEQSPITSKKSQIEHASGDSLPLYQLSQNSKQFSLKVEEQSIPKPEKFMNQIIISPESLLKQKKQKKQPSEDEIIMKTTVKSVQQRLDKFWFPNMTDGCLQIMQNLAAVKSKGKRTAKSWSTLSKQMKEPSFENDVSQDIRRMFANQFGAEQLLEDNSQNSIHQHQLNQISQKLSQKQNQKVQSPPPKPQVVKGSDQGSNTSKSDSKKQKKSDKKKDDLIDKVGQNFKSDLQKLEDIVYAGIAIQQQIQQNPNIQTIVEAPKQNQFSTFVQHDPLLIGKQPDIIPESIQPVVTKTASELKAEQDLKVWQMLNPQGNKHGVTPLTITQAPVKVQKAPPNKAPVAQTDKRQTRQKSKDQDAKQVKGTEELKNDPQKPPRKGGKQSQNKKR